MDVFVRNKGNVKQKDVRVSVFIPELNNYYERSSEFDIKKGKQERVSFSGLVPADFDGEYVYVIVTASNNKDENAEVIGFLVE